MAVRVVLLSGETLTYERGDGLNVTAPPGLLVMSAQNTVIAVVPWGNFERAETDLPVATGRRDPGFKQAPDEGTSAQSSL